MLRDGLEPDGAERQTGEGFIIQQEYFQKLHMTPFLRDRRTAVVEYVRVPLRFSSLTKTRGDYSFKENETAMFGRLGKLRPWADAHFEGVTPLGSPALPEIAEVGAGGFWSTPWGSKALPSLLANIRTE
jgi:hypothetical protein